jgi:hypothetical protein
MNFYEILEIDSRASNDDIERAYRKMARKVHPDLNAGDRGRAEARMKLLNEIRDLLTDPLLRAGYDERLRLENEQRARAAPRPTPEAPPRASAGSTDDDGSARRRAGPILLAFGGAMTAGILFISFRMRATAPAPEVTSEPGTRSPPTRPPAFTAIAPAAGAGARLEALAPPLPPSGLDVPTPRMRPGASPRGLSGAAMFAGPRSPFRGHGVVHIGSTAADVLRVLGPPDSVEPGRAAGDAVFHYGALRLEMKNGRVTSGDAAARQ